MCVGMCLCCCAKKHEDARAVSAIVTFVNFVVTCAVSYESMIDGHILKALGGLLSGSLSSLLSCCHCADDKKRMF